MIKNVALGIAKPDMQTNSGGLWVSIPKEIHISRARRRTGHKNPFFAGVNGSAKSRQMVVR